MSPSTKARRSEAESSLDLVAWRAVPTTLYPRSRKARTIPAPMPWEAPVTITVLFGFSILRSLHEAFLFGPGLFVPVHRNSANADERYDCNRQSKRSVSHVLST